MSATEDPYQGVEATLPLTTRSCLEDLCGDQHGDLGVSLLHTLGDDDEIKITTTEVNAVPLASVTCETEVAETRITADHDTHAEPFPDKLHDKSDLLSDNHLGKHEEVNGNEGESLHEDVLPKTDVHATEENLRLTERGTKRPCPAEKELEESPTKRFNVGAVPGFASQVPMPQLITMATQPDSPDRPILDSQSWEEKEICDRVVADPSGVFVIVQDEPIHTTQFHPDCTIGQLAVATDRLEQMQEPIKVTTAVGTQLPLASKIEPGSFVRFQKVGRDSQWICRGHQTYSERPVLQQRERAHLLWQQEGWVATDEMTYYMHMVQMTHPETTCILIDVKPDVDYHVVLTDRILKAISNMHEQQQAAVAIAVLYKSHWFPIFLRVSQQIELRTTTHEAQLIRDLLTQAVGLTDQVDIHTDVMPHSFPADCGFQTIGWLISKILGDDTNIPWADDQACKWRALFHRHLKYQGIDKEFILTPLRLGGATIVAQLQTLLESHGVNADRSQQCADHLIDKLGKAGISSILKSPKPWADLKARANMVSPPIRIVLAEELKQAVQKRSKLSDPVGSKANKRPASGVKHVQVQADQISVPQSVFKQDDGTELTQINIQQVHQTSRGIVVANIAEAVPYFGLTNPISNEGLGLLILDHNDPRIPEPKKIVQVPAHCRDTSEPIIVNAALLQLGRKEVLRNVPAQCLAVQELENQVVRVMVYKDQFPGAWDMLVNQPVKLILQDDIFSHIKTEDILDVWDRQFMSAHLSKCPAKASEIFSANLRLVSKVTAPLLQASGTRGIYCEPRSDDGRVPDERYQVIWLPQKTYSETIVSQKTTDGECHLVRNQNRYGLRVPKDNAERVHAVHRPDQSFIPGTVTQKFRMGPMPYGTTKQSVLNICQKWGWQCRPLGPQGQTPDRMGTYWMIQAAAQPPSWIYHLAHGDVLISQITTQQIKEQPKAAQILASTKTLTSLAKTTKPDQHSSDPWLHDDPWKATKGSKELSVGQYAAMEASLEQKLLAKISDSSSRASDDSTMDEGLDSRVGVLEAKLEQLAQSVQTFQAGQQQHNASVVQQVKQLDAKVDHQVQSFHQALDNKLSDQMSKIEALFKKRTLGE